MHDSGVREQKNDESMVLERKWGQQGWGVPQTEFGLQVGPWAVTLPTYSWGAGCAGQSAGCVGGMGASRFGDKVL